MIPKRHKAEENTEAWLMSYADMITLLLCFFIIFVSVSEPKKERIAAIANGMAGKFGAVDLSSPFAGLVQSLEGVVESHHMLREVDIIKTSKGLEIELSNSAFFEDDSAALIQSRLPVLTELAGALKSADRLDYHIIVEGHTSDVEVNNPDYPTNWELSSARAAHVVRLFIEQGIKPDRLTAAGYAGTVPKVPNLDASGHPIPQNREKNQRMVITLERAM